MEEWRRLENAASGETITFLETAEETGDRRLVMLVDVAPGAGPLLHSHRQEETFELVSGEVEVTHGRTARTLGTGEAVVVPGGDLHRFVNVGDGPATVRVTVAPPLHFERTMRVLWGLARDGRLGEMGERPPEPALMMALCRTSDFYMPPVPRPVWNAMRAVLAPFGRRAYDEAVRTYDRERPAPGERVGRL